MYHRWLTCVAFAFVACSGDDGTSNSNQVPEHNKQEQNADPTQKRTGSPETNPTTHGNACVPGSIYVYYRDTVASPDGHPYYRRPYAECPTCSENYRTKTERYSQRVGAWIFDQKTCRTEPTAPNPNAEYCLMDRIKPANMGAADFALNDGGYDFLIKANYSSSSNDPACSSEREIHANPDGTGDLLDVCSTVYIRTDSVCPVKVITQPVNMGS